MNPFLTSSASTESTDSSAFKVLENRKREILGNVDFDPTSYLEQRSFQLQYDLQELLIAFEEYLANTHTLYLLHELESNWDNALAVKFPLDHNMYGGLLSDVTVQVYKDRAREITSQTIYGAYRNPITGVIEAHPANLNAAERKRVTEELHSIQQQLSNHQTSYQHWKNDVAFLSYLI